MPDASLTRFDHFMGEALYGPRGYYTGPSAILGPRGDFTTSPKLDGRLAKRISKWILEAWGRWGCSLPIIELGPGDGTLAHDLRSNLPYLKRKRLKYHFVEVSPSLARRQKELNPKGHWHTTLNEALKETAGRGLIISNEFFDAFPVRIFRSEHEELFLDDSRQEHWLPIQSKPDSLLFDSPPARFEVAESIHHWINRNLTLFQCGEILTIDYGGDQKENYHRRPLGTLRSYCHHMRFYPPEAFQNPGKQDLTFDIFFPDLMRWTEAIGLQTINYMTQATFLEAENQLGADGAFKVLHQKTP